MKNYTAPPFIFLILLGFAFSCNNTTSYSSFSEDTAHLRDTTLAPFYHGVASGDPLYDRVIIWTRVTPNDSLPSIEVKWEISKEENFNTIHDEGTVVTDPSRDYTIKVDVAGLTDDTHYYYRFHALESTSITGRTKTASKNPASVKLGVVSCSNYEWGFFNAYGALADEDLDAVVHLGDYIYEYGPGGYGDTSLNRTPIPAKETVTLQDYRTRYAQYRLDEDLRYAHSRHPFINIWDDHEIANNSYKEGALNHQPEKEGSYEERKNAARQVYYEWIPIRESEKHYRKFEFGGLADLIMLDERLEGRTYIADSLSDPSLLDSSRTMLGLEQRNWLIDQLSNSNTQWKIIGNQVIFSYLNWGFENWKINLDSWDGYPIEQQLIADAIVNTPVENVVFITGDTHTAWAFEVTNKPFDNYNPTTAEGAIAVEFGTTSINSSNSNERFSDSLVLLHEQKIVNSNINPHLKYANMRDHGYLLLNLDTTSAIAQYKFVETIKERGNYNIKDMVSYKVDDGKVKLYRN